MLPVTHGLTYTRRQILIYTFILIVTTLIPCRLHGWRSISSRNHLVKLSFLTYVVRMQFNHRSVRLQNLQVFDRLLELTLLLFIDHYEVMEKLVTFLN